MPTYEYVCGECGHRGDQVRSIDNRDRLEQCEQPDPGGQQCIGVPQRDVIRSMTAHTDKGYQSPILSDALGIHPSQINDAKRRFPHHNFAPDGRMILSSHGERNKVMRELGFFDKT